MSTARPLQPSLLLATWLLPFGLWLPGASAAPPQAPSTERSRIKGQVQDVAGEPWNGATVELRSEPELAIPEAGARDVVVARTDAKGAFRAKILPGRRYTAFAWATNGSGEIRRTRILRDVSLGQETQLAEALERGSSIEIRLFGLEAWRGRRVSATVVDEGGNAHALELDAGGRAKIPPLPGESAELEIFAGSMSLTTRRIELESKVRRHAQVARRASAEEITRDERVEGLAPLPADALADPNAECVYVGPPRVLRVRVLSEGEEVDGASIDVALSGHGFTETLATTDEDGIARVKLALPVDDFGRPRDATTLEIQVSCPGFELAPRRIELSTWLTSREDAEAYDVQLDEGRSARIRLLNARDEARAGAPVLVEVLHTVARARRRSESRRLRVLRCSRNGVIEVGGLGERAFINAIALLVPGDAQNPHLQRLPLDLDASELHNKRGIHDAHVAGEAHTLTVLDPDGRPARFAQVEVVRRASDWYESSLFRQRYQCDRRGRAQIRAGDGFVFALSRDAWGHAACEAILRGKKPKLRLIALTRQGAKLRSPDDTPVAGARVRLLRHAGRMPEALREALGALPYTCNARLLDATSDAKGRVELRWISWTDQDLLLHVKQGERAGRVKLRARLGEDDVTLRTELERPGG